MGKLIVISGASGVGKGTVLNLMMRKQPDLMFSVSATTRDPRPNEVDGVHYYFVTRETFEEMIRNGEFLEYDEHAKNYYGTPRAQAEEKMEKGHVLLDIEPAGAKQVRAAMPEAKLIFIMPPNREELERRLGAVAIRRRIRSRSAWSGPNGKWSRMHGMTISWSTRMLRSAPKKF